MTLSACRVCELTRIACVMLTLVLAPFLLGRFDLLGFGWFHLVVLIAGLPWGIERVLERRVTWRATLPSAALLFFVAASCLSLPRTVCSHDSVLEFLRLVDLVVFCWLCSSMARDRDLFLLALTAFVAGAALVAVYGLVQYVMAGDRSWRIFGAFDNPNLLAAYMVLAIPFAATARGWGRHRAWAWCGLIAAAVCLCALLLTGSRGGVLAFGAGTVAALAAAGAEGRKRFPRRRLAAVFVLVLAAGLVAARPIAVRLAASLTSQSHSMAFRVKTWEGTLRMIAAHPLTGTGLGTFEVACPRYAVVGFTRMAHNNYLQTASEGGLLAGLCFTGFIASLLLAGWRNARGSARGTDDDVRWIGVATVAGVTGFAVQSVTDYGWYVSAIPIVLGLCAATAALGEAGRKRSESLELVLSPRQAAVASALWVSVVAVLAFLVLRQLPAEGHGADAKTYLFRGNLNVAVLEARQATALDPRCAEYHATLANALAERYVTLHDTASCDEAVRQYRLAMALQRTRPSHCYRLARLYFEDERLKECAAMLQRAVYWDPNYVSAWCLLGDLHRREGNTVEARKTYERAARIYRSDYGQVKALPELVDINYGRAFLALGQLALEGKDCQRAEAVLSDAAKVMDDYFKFLPYFGAVMQATETALMAPESEARPLAADVYSCLAQAELECGSETQAREAAEKALTVSPETGESALRQTLPNDFVERVFAHAQGTGTARPQP